MAKYILRHMFSNETSKTIYAILYDVMYLIIISKDPTRVYAQIFQDSNFDPVKFTRTIAFTRLDGL